MSRKVCVQFEVMDMLILKNTLKQMGHDFTERGQDVVEIQRSYHNISFNAKSGQVSYDDMNGPEVNKIKQQYMLNFYRDKAIREGNQVREEVQANGEIVLHVLR